MAKEVGNRAKRNHIQAYFNENYSDSTILSDGLESNEPTIKFETINRIITLSSDKYGNVIEDYRMKKGCGSKQDYIKKEAAFKEISNFKEKHYKNIPEKSSSFEESYIKLQTDEYNITILYDFKTKTIAEKKRNRNKVKTIDNNVIASKKEKPIVSANKELVIDEPVIKEKKPRKKGYKENDKVLNIYDKQKYTVLSDMNGIVKVCDNTRNYYIMATADIMKA